MMGYVYTQMAVKGSDLIAVLNVVRVVDVCRDEVGVAVRLATLGEVDDPSHTGIFGYTASNAKTAETLSKIVASDEVHTPSTP